MSATTVNAFPPLHTFNSPRSWLLAAIVLMHLGFFWALTHGLASYVLPPPQQGPLQWVDVQPSRPPKPTPQPETPTGVTRTVIDPVPLPPPVDYRDAIDELAPQAPPAAGEIPQAPGSAVPLPVIVEPALDPRYPFTEPEYPVAEIRQNHEGTVLLALQILPNGRVGAVRIEKSSGFARLDESAAREARSWRMKPGTSDGTAVAMWKLVPIRFQIKN